MSTFVVKCPKCQSALDVGMLNTGGLQPCGACHASVEAEVFPALFRRAERGVEGERVMMDGEASCFYHPAKKAVRPCVTCGRFMCALCDCELHGEHYCPSCLEAGRKKGKIKSLDNRRMLYDSLALKLATYPWLFIVTYFVSVLAAPAALFFAIRYWNAPRSLLHRTKARLIAAIILSLLQIAFWIFIVVMIFVARANNV